MDKRIIMTADDINLALQRVVLQILERNQKVEELAVVGIHTCGVYLAERIVERIYDISDVEVDSGNLDITLYRDDWSTIAQSPVVKTTNILFPVEGRNLVLVDDVVFTGRTIRAALDAIMDYGRPRSIQLAALVDRGGRELPIQPDYVGMTISVRANERIQVQLSERDDLDQVVIES